jgi:hypothetical protein
MASKEILVATSYQSHVSPVTRKLPEGYVKWLDETLGGLEDHGYDVANALRDNDFRIEDDPAAAHEYDIAHVRACDVFLAILDERSSRGVQTGIGRAEMLGKPILLGHTATLELHPFNRSLVEVGVAHEITMPIDYDQLDRVIGA